MIVSKLFIYLASGELNGDGFWIIDTTSNELPLIENKYLLDCHRKELIGEESAKEIKFAINLNINNINKELIKQGYNIERPIKGISFSYPLDLLENIFDFWFEAYKDPLVWETCLGLLKMKQRLPLTSLIMSNGIKGNAKEWAPKIESLHNYRPDSINIKDIKKPMWK
ncbi:MAG: josephin [Prochlorococcus sp. SP3034]|nr:josephin [Prochlorococcus sp. SP3034]